MKYNKHLNEQKLIKYKWHYILSLGSLVLFLFTNSVLHAQWGSRSASILVTQRDTDDNNSNKKWSSDTMVDEHAVLMEFDKITKEWTAIAKEFGSYKGLTKYCSEREFRNEVDALLGAIHHYDTLLYGILINKTLHTSNPELKITIREIEKVEKDFKPKNFHEHLNQDCRHRRKLERNKEKTKNDMHIYSYDGQVLIIENDIRQYVQRITRLVGLIHKHAFHLIK